MKKANRILSCVLAFILAFSLVVPAFAYTPEDNPYIDRNTVIGSDFSITWDAAEPRGNYDMCIYPINSGSPTYVKFNDTDVSTMGGQHYISGKFLKDAIKERAEKDNLTGVNTFSLRINEENSAHEEGIDYSFFKVDLSTMKIVGNKFTKIKNVNLVIDFKSDDRPITTDTPNVKIDTVLDDDTGNSVYSIYTDGTHKIRVQLKADEGFSFDGAMTVTAQGKTITVTETSVWGDYGHIVFETDIEKDEVPGQAPSFFARVFAAIRDFFIRVAYFFRSLFHISMPV